MRTSRAPRTTWVVALGICLVAAGCVLIGYVGWQLWGTTYVAVRERERVVAEVERLWKRPRDRGAAPSADARDVVALVRVPRFGADYAVPVRRGTTDEVLAGGLGWFDGHAGPGERGNFALAGHRVTHGEPLRAMPSLRPGDEVVVETASRTYTYVLDTAGDAVRVPFDRTWVLAERPVNPDGGPQPPRGAGDRLLTLTTCAELFHTDDRLVAFGHLVDSRPRPAVSDARGAMAP